LGLFVYFNFQIISFLEEATPHKYVGVQAQSKLISPSTLGQPQTLASPFSVIEFIFETLKRNIRLMRILDDESSWKSITKLSNEF